MVIKCHCLTYVDNIGPKLKKAEPKIGWIRQVGQTGTVAEVRMKSFEDALEMRKQCASTNIHREYTFVNLFLNFHYFFEHFFKHPSFGPILEDR